MKTTLLCLAAIAQFALYATAEPIQRIPLYYKRTDVDDFMACDARELKNGMLGGTVQIGNPPQNFTMAFDTSTGYSWVTGIQCTDTNCEERSPYDPRNSTTVISTNQNYTMNYGDAIVYSQIYLDTFRFNGLTVTNMPFGSALNMKGFNKGYDGYLGLGRNVNLNIAENSFAKRAIPASGFVPNAFQQGSGLRSSQFGMYTTSIGSSFSDSGFVSVNQANQVNQVIQASSANQFNQVNQVGQNNQVNQVNQVNQAGQNNQVNQVSQVGQNNGQNNQISQMSGVTSGGFGIAKRHYNEPAGYLIIGGIDTDAIKGKLYTIDVADDNGSGSWAVPIRQAKFEDDLYFKVAKNAKAVLSSSTDVIGLPNKQADEFKEHWYAVYDEPDNTYQVPCCLMDRFTSFKVKLGDIHAVIPPSYWSHPREVDSCCEMCRTRIGRSGSDTDYVIGSSFTNAFYSQFDPDNDSIGFAMKKSHVNDGLKLWKD
ncbi:hypothetical protein HPULCUR_001942 [Helicostylum pulchrum]|uniref:Peptidase A1 domain-containing protein n=1 Tax=Helicostylum pulchrum TaxID=562976 RepID=A0ABP9XQF9_9FUNG